MKKYFFFFAVAAWLLSLIVHVLSLTDYDVAERFPFVWLLHVGIFVAFIPAIFELKKNQPLEQRDGREWGRKRILLSQVFKNTPRWLTIIAIACFVYAFINFMLFMSTQKGTPEVTDGVYTLQNHGKFMRTLTAEEYHHYKANTVRGFSGHWLAFYAFSAAILFPFKKQG